MSGQESSEKPPEVKEIPWQGEGKRYSIPDSDFFIEEVKEPWDLFLESKYLKNSLGNPIHVIAVKNGIERIFSIRDPKRKPVADILTMPVGARSLDCYYSTLRALKTSHPMEIDGQQLIVLDVLKNDERVSRPLIELTKRFFVHNKGKLGYEHDHYLALNSKSEIKKWGRIIKGKVKKNLLVSTEPKNYPVHAHAGNTEEALALLATDFFEDLYVNVDDEWTNEVMNHTDANPLDRPTLFRFFGDPKRIQYAIDWVKAMK